MPKSKDRKRTVEVVDDARVKEVVDLLVDFAEERKLPARIMMLAMEYIVDKIRTHLEIETITVPESETTH